MKHELLAKIISEIMNAEKCETAYQHKCLTANI